MNQFDHIRTLEVGKEVLDLTALHYGWEDKWGVIEEIDGSMVKVKYRSGNSRWKKCTSIRLHPENTN